MTDEDSKTTISVKTSTKEELSLMGNKGETFDDIIHKTIGWTKCFMIFLNLLYNKKIIDEKEREKIKEQIFESVTYKKISD